MSQEKELQFELETAMNQIAVPDSLLRFAKDIPSLCEQGQLQASPAPVRSGRRFVPAVLKGTAAAAVIAFTLTAGVQVSPALASYMKSVPGFDIAAQWLTKIRSHDGVQVAVNNGYTPIEPVTTQFGGTQVTISDVYLTDDELLFKAFIRTNEYDVTDASSPVHFWVRPTNLRGGGSTTGSSIAETTDGNQTPVLQVSYKYQLEENEVRNFFAKGLSELVFEITKSTSNREIKDVRFEKVATMSVPVDQNKLLHNKVLEPKQALALPVEHPDPDWKELSLEKLTIQPTTMNVVIFGKKGWSLQFPRENENAPYLKDVKGNVFRYDPSGPGLMLEDGRMQLPFSSSLFFDTEAKELYLHIGTVLVSEREPSGTLELSMKDEFPKSVRYKNKHIVIEAAEYHDGYLHLKVKKEIPGQSQLEGVYFFIKEYNDQILHNDQLREEVNTLREKLNIPGFGTADSIDSSGSYLDLYIPASKQDNYMISLRRVSDPLVINQDYPISLK
ncbi:MULTISPECIES: DUF4179 domain-containing protein [unclassified Paenibacillus]|uniref:DUF4179 domain-containing protein n=1 Tax=unclassified Paenibacillus TaxID=185978 RepID=UPI001AE91CF9|nr:MULTISPECIES: DUF4179 domain-containing protein [unclassified Paenibacillus]MBP1155659.1 hypothetical protein [Paenibacillus sp. PvP091]MBP1168955.1 hypothetical protein [Paenibacillus sp. PvR098]MBP2439983.1 hypothetical protein [Paenibacillus sp. PvP052]